MIADKILIYCKIFDSCSIPSRPYLTKKMKKLSMNRIKNWTRENKILSLIMLCGLVLRVIPILWGIPILPYIGGYHPDEPKAYRTIINFPGIYLTTNFFQGYGTTVQFIIGFILLPLKLVLVKLLGLKGHYAVIAIVFSRFVSVLAGTATIYLIFHLSKKIFDKKVGLISAAFFATAFYPTMNSSLITLDVIMGFLLIANFILCIYALENNRLSPYMILGVATGILIGTKITSALFIAVPFILNLLKTLYPNGSEENNSPTKNAIFLVAYWAVAGIVFLTFNPHIAIDPIKYVQFFLIEKSVWIDAVKVPISDMFSIWAREIATCVGFPIAFLAIGGILIPGKRYLRYKCSVIIFIICSLFIWRWHLQARFVIFVIPFFCMFAAHLCILILDRKHKAFRLLGTACIVITLSYSVFLCLNGLYIRLADTRVAAGKFIEENLPTGSTIGISRVSDKYTWKTHRWRYPRVNFIKFKELDLLEEPDYLVMSSYDFDRIIKTIKSGKLSFNYKLDKANHKEWYRLSAPSPEIFRFYDNLFIKKNLEYDLVKKFYINVNVPIEFPAPEILIFKSRKKIEGN